MRKVAVDVLHRLFEVQETLDDEGDAETEMVSLSTIGAHLIDWTDPRKCYVTGNQLTLGDEGVVKKAVNGDVHLEFARDLLEKLAEKGVTSTFLFSTLFAKISNRINRRREEIVGAFTVQTAGLTSVHPFSFEGNIRARLLVNRR
jgi:hypothetical protein